MDKIIQTDPNQTNRGKAYAVTSGGDLVLLAPQTELRVGWHWATEDEVRVATNVAKILKEEPDAPIDQVRDHVQRFIEANDPPADSAPADQAPETPAQ